MKKTEICHVCGKEKKPYTVILTGDIFSYIHYEHAREDGPICERCDRYYAMTGDFKDPSEEEFNLAVDAAKFANAMTHWWEKDKKLNHTTSEDMRDWPGHSYLAAWYREYYGKKNKVENPADKGVVIRME